MPKIDSQKFYINAIKKYGLHVKSLHWLSTHHQEVRFKQILQLLPDNLSSYSLADAGCGFADFYHYLSKHTKVLKSYTGIDSLIEMTKIANLQTQKEILHLDICKDALPKKDYYICSGALNILTAFETHLFIQNCYHAAQKAFIFNVLYGDIDSKTYNYLSKKQLASMAEQLQVKKVVYKEGYLKNDITVMFLKE